MSNLVKDGYLIVDFMLGFAETGSAAYEWDTVR